jgi:adenine deaminase
VAKRQLILRLHRIAASPIQSAQAYQLALHIIQESSNADLAVLGNLSACQVLNSFTVGVTNSKDIYSKATGRKPKRRIIRGRNYNPGRIEEA